jgi:CheY-like chemotaxis protein
LFDGLISDVQVAHSGEEAIAMAQQQPPDLVLCDLGMPGMDGYEICRRLRRLPALQYTAMVAVSGYGGESQVRASKEAGFDQHLVKPISRADLVQLVRPLVERERRSGGDLEPGRSAAAGGP